MKPFLNIIKGMFKNFSLHCGYKNSVLNKDMHLYSLWPQGLERWQLGIHTFILQPKGTIKEVIHDIKNT